MAEPLTLQQEFDPILDIEISQTDLSPIMVYMPDVVNAGALPFLAQQFNVDGDRGWNLATTETAQRELIKNAIQIQRKVGTPSSIKNALNSLGYSNVTIVEKASILQLYDGSHSYNGQIIYDGGTAGAWVNFGVIIGVPDPSQITSDEQSQIKTLINEYKSARCVLIYVNFVTQK